MQRSLRLYNVYTRILQVTAGVRRVVVQVGEFRLQVSLEGVDFISLLRPDNMAGAGTGGRAKVSRSNKPKAS